MNEHQKRRIGRFQALIHEGTLTLQHMPGYSDGVSITLTPSETVQLLEWLYQNSNSVSQVTPVLAVNSEQGSLNDLLASFVYQRAL